MSGKFLRVKCKCGKEEVLFSTLTTVFNCSGCNNKLAEPTGGEAAIFGKVIKEVKEVD